MKQILISFIADVDEEFSDKNGSFLKLYEKIEEVMPHRVYNGGYRELSSHDGVFVIDIKRYDCKKK